MTTINQLKEQAYSRGYTRGTDDAFADCYNEAPLSGEFAGESIEELLGDLLRQAEKVTHDFPTDDIHEIFTEIMDSYEEGYRGAHFDNEQEV